MLCSICLKETPQLMSVLDDLAIKLNVTEIVNKHLFFKPLLSDSSTSKICTNCWQKIEDFHHFYENVKKIHEDYENKQDFVKQENKLCSSNIKLENEEMFEDNLMQINVEITEEDNPLVNEAEEDGKYEKQKEESDDYEPSEISDEDYETYKKNTTIKDKRRSTKKSIRRRKSNPEICDDSIKKRKISTCLDPILTEKAIKKHVQMACNLCIYVGQSFSDITEHFRRHHVNIKPYVMCCNRKFTKNCILAEHAYIQENPNAFSCAECNKSFTTNYGLRIHIISYHASEEERTHACDQCPRKFGRRNLLELHKQVHIPKEQWTIICTKCTNRTAKFATEYHFNLHNSMYHKREVNICQVCAKEIKDKKAFEKHVRAHFEDSGPRLKCPIENCESWLKDEDSLKNHIQRTHLDNKDYNCPECNRVFPNRSSLWSHKHYFHTKQIFRCEQCDKTFKKALTLKEHMTQHTGETLYNCPFCTKTFNSNANMHAHKKKQHPVEWDVSRKKKLGLLPK